MDGSLSILEEAISDVGYWNWWAEKLPKRFQLEFGGAQLLYSEPEREKPPSSRIALSFLNPISINFLTRKDSDAPENWPILLHEDKFAPQTISYDRFTFQDNELIKTIIKETVSYKNIFGHELEFSDKYQSKVQLAFWAGTVGLYIVAERMDIITSLGYLKLESVVELNKKWWEYWKDYWEKKKSSNPYPKDYACEVTFPIKS